jgi:hypothetical protein
VEYDHCDDSKAPQAIEAPESGVCLVHRFGSCTEMHGMGAMVAVS